MIRKPREMLSLTFSIFLLGLFLIVFDGNDLKSAEPNPLKTRPHETRVIGHAAYEPSFLTKTGTLDPVVIARNGWKGYLTKMCEPWGLLQGLKPTIRCFFDNRVLPFAELKHHAVDGFDINVRSLGAHAILHEMLGKEKLVVKKAMPDADAATQSSEVEKRMKESLATAARMEGRRDS